MCKRAAVAGAGVNIVKENLNHSKQHRDGKKNKIFPGRKKGGF